MDPTPADVRPGEAHAVPPAIPMERPHRGRIPQRHVALVLTAGGLLALYILARLLLLERFPYFVDEATYGSYTYKAAHSVHDLFRSFELGREPFMFWLGIPAVELGVNPLTAVRLVSIASGLLTAIVVGLLGRAAGGAAVGVTAAALCVVLPFTFVYDGIGIVEPLVTLILATSLLLQIKLARKPSLTYAALLGLVVAAGVLTKENTKPALVLIPLGLLLFDWSPSGRRRRLGVWLAGVAIVAVLVGAAELVLRSSSLYGELEASRRSSFLYAVRPIGDALLHPFTGWGKNWAIYAPAFTGYITWPLLVAAAAGTVMMARDRLHLAIVMIAWIVLPLVVSLTFATYTFPRHVMPLLPPAIVLMAYGGVQAGRWALRALRPRYAIIACAGATVAILSPALAFDLRVIAHPATTRYPGLDDAAYVTDHAGAVWPAVARTIRQRNTGSRVVVIQPQAAVTVKRTRTVATILELLLGPSRRYVFVSVDSPLVAQAQFGILPPLFNTRRTPLSDAYNRAAHKALHEAFGRAGLVRVRSFPTPRGGAPVGLYGRITALTVQRGSGWASLRTVAVRDDAE